MALPCLHIIGAVGASATVDADAPAAGIDLQTVLLVLVAGILVFLLKLLLEMRGRLDRLEARLAPAIRRGTGDEGGADGAIPGEIVAVIAASVMVAVGSAHRIVALHPVSPEARAWSLEGRRQVFQSHQIR